MQTKNVMNSLTLISHPLCPFVQRAAIVLLEKQVPFERINVNLRDKPAWFLELSPSGKVPLLQVRRPDGTTVVLFESMAICEYLLETQPGPSLYPEDAVLRAMNRAWIELSTTTLGDAWAFLNAKDAPTANAWAISLEKKLAQFERVLEHGPYFNGDRFGMVDVAMAPVFRYFDVLQPASWAPLLTRYPRIDAWHRAVLRRPNVVAAVSPDYSELLRTHFGNEIQSA
jgi:glutathione S-transferase